MTSKTNQPGYTYLNRGDMSKDLNLFISKLAAEIRNAQAKAPPSQWKNFINGLTSKGVKKTEIDDSGILPHLELNAAPSMTKQEIIDWLNSNLPVVKELPLKKPAYGSYKQPGECKYQEALLLLASQKEIAADCLAELIFELEEFNFDIERLAADPAKAIALSEQITEMTHKKAIAEGHRVSHFSNIIDPDTGQTIQNMIAHMRFSIRGDLFFIEEIQSDWAQRGRRADWKNIPQGPFVTNTEAWSGLVLRRLLQRAASDPNIKRVAWIHANMRNGGNGDADRQVYDGLNDFYLKILPKMADKLLAGTGQKIQFGKFTFGDKEQEVPSFEMTDAAREKLKKAQFLYSRDLLDTHIDHRSDAEMRRLNLELKRAKEMLGSVVSIRLAKQVLDAATGEEVAGRQLGPLIEISMRARNPSMTASHEVWHYAHDHLIGTLDREAIERAFAPGTRLNLDVRQALIKDGASSDAIAQCDDPTEAAAHGYALWTAGKIFMTHSEKNRQESIEGGAFGLVGKTFKAVEGAFIGLGNWVRRVCYETTASRDTHRAADIFHMLQAGRYRQECSTVFTYESSEIDKPAVLRSRLRTG